MKLIGSKIEADFREELTAIRKFISPQKSSVLLTLKIDNYDTDNIVTFHCFADGTDVFYGPY